MVEVKLGSSMTSYKLNENEFHNEIMLQRQQEMRGRQISVLNCEHADNLQSSVGQIIDIGIGFIHVQKKKV